MVTSILPRNLIADKSSSAFQLLRSYLLEGWSVLLLPIGWTMVEYCNFEDALLLAAIQDLQACLYVTSNESFSCAVLCSMWRRGEYCQVPLRAVAPPERDENLQNRRLKWAPTVEPPFSQDFLAIWDQKRSFFCQTFPLHFSCISHISLRIDMRKDGWHCNHIIKSPN